MINSYFKVANGDVMYFFNTHDKDTIEGAWKRACKAAEACASLKITNTPYYNLISVWKKPYETGPWSLVPVIGEYGSNMTRFMETNLN